MQGDTCLSSQLSGGGKGFGAQDDPRCIVSSGVSMRYGLKNIPKMGLVKCLPPSWQQAEIKWCSYISQGQGRWRSFVHPSFMPGLVAKAVLCLGLIKVKPSTHQRRERKREQGKGVVAREALPCVSLTKSVKKARQTNATNATGSPEQRPPKPSNVWQGEPTPHSTTHCLLGYTHILSKQHTSSQAFGAAKRHRPLYQAAS